MLLLVEQRRTYIGFDMKVVIYTHDMLPITIIDLPHWAIEHIKEHKYLDVPTKPKFCNVLSSTIEATIPKIQQSSVVRITAEVFVRGIEKLSCYLLKMKKKLLQLYVLFYQAKPAL